MKIKFSLITHISCRYFILAKKNLYLLKRLKKKKKKKNCVKLCQSSGLC